jgi:hypothetical protein
MLPDATEQSQENDRIYIGMKEPGSSFYFVSRIVEWQLEAGHEVPERCHSMQRKKLRQE